MSIETVSASSSWNPSARVPEHAQRERELRRREQLRASRGGPGDRGPGVEIERLGPGPRVDAGGFEHRERAVAELRSAAPGAASCAAGRTRRAPARTARRATARRPAARRGARCGRARTRRSAAGGTPCGGTDADDLAPARSTRPSPRSRRSRARPGRGQPLPDLALHHDQQRPDHRARLRGTGRRSASPRCTGGWRRASSRPAARASSAPRSSVSASPWTTWTSGRSATTSASAGRTCRSSSSAVTDAPASASATVSEPMPGPISSDVVARLDLGEPHDPPRGVRVGQEVLARAPGSAGARAVRRARRSSPGSAGARAHARSAGRIARRDAGVSTRGSRGRRPGSGGRDAGTRRARGR